MSIDYPVPEEPHGTSVPHTLASNQGVSRISTSPTLYDYLQNQQATSGSSLDPNNWSDPNLSQFNLADSYEPPCADCEPHSIHRTAIRMSAVPVDSARTVMRHTSAPRDGPRDPRIVVAVASDGEMTTQEMLSMMQQGLPNTMGQACPSDCGSALQVLDDVPGLVTVCHSSSPGAEGMVLDTIRTFEVDLRFESL